MLFQRRCAEGASAVDGAIDGAYSAGLIFDGHFDARSDGGPVGLDPYHVQIDPVISIARVFEQAENMAVPGRRAADRSDDVFIAVIIDVRKDDTVPFV